mmetsp:Transcript_12495/g.18341  ORF Transcript_12495/g.18341 Transcript_12495/m.18341 type:complete len:321 (-) Transcript_12495:72-1034(-)|eukprot:CAMPEP_0194216060 /NCGR_PEP_ID=MMETSP0156-20130528/18239_1 /TAXON_ID=33649 /ORGANISM="Thalassionema nitzschioides, Strain L26-B" /LENGTH=320 /DNA_ID=CAMNT_0038944733 /DNA_START=79 /DNA_END=1041 /DNA_ORIENTATION=+
MTTSIGIDSVDASLQSTRVEQKIHLDTWQDHFEDLLKFKAENGHCLVPHTFPEKPSLARWVKRQRYQYKLMQLGKSSSMSSRRINTLENIGFVWDSHKATWDKIFHELLQYKKEHSHCDIPSKYAPNPALATWVTRQRSQYKLYVAGKQSHMTEERFVALDEIGFKWSARQLKPPSKPKCGKRKAPKKDPEPMKKLPLSSKDYDLFMDVLCDLDDDGPDKVYSSCTAAYPKPIEIPSHADLSSKFAPNPANIFLDALNDFSDNEVDSSVEFSMESLFPKEEKNMFAEDAPVSKTTADFLDNVIADMSDDEDSVCLDDISL